jgi:hypothetical protein
MSSLCVLISELSLPSWMSAHLDEFAEANLPIGLLALTGGGSIFPPPTLVGCM